MSQPEAAIVFGLSVPFEVMSGALNTNSVSLSASTGERDQGEVSISRL